MTKVPLDLVLDMNYECISSRSELVRVQNLSRAQILKRLSDKG